jgi:hypothetical protein
MSRANADYFADCDGITVSGDPGLVSDALSAHGGDPDLDEENVFKPCWF